MTERFEIGEIAIYVGPPNVIPTGTEVEVASALRPHKSDGVLGYEVICHQRPRGLETWFAEARDLRKKPKRRDIDQLVSWDDMPWKPKEINHTSELERVIDNLNPFAELESVIEDLKKERAQ